MSFLKYNQALNLITRHEVVSVIPIPVLQTTFLSADSAKEIESFQITHSNHSYLRSLQRGFKTSDLLNVLEYGEQIEKQGMVFHVIIPKKLPQNLAKYFKDKMQEWVVITNLNQTQIITCYKAKGALKRLKRKVKSLICYV